MREATFGCDGTNAMRKCCWAMSNDHVSPFDPLAARAQIYEEFRIAIEKFGKDHIEVITIASSWGDTMDNGQVLAALRALNQTGSMFDNITDRAYDQ
jgi:hypothetical protein